VLTSRSPVARILGADTVSEQRAALYALAVELGVIRSIPSPVSPLGNRCCTATSRGYCLFAPSARRSPLAALRSRRLTTIEIKAGEETILLLEKEEALTRQAACHRAVELHDAQVRHYCALEKLLPSFASPIDQHLARYCEGMRIWMRANYDWSTVTPRYNPG
jgi:hypothetical protein